MYEANFSDLVNRDNSTLGNWSSKQGEEQSMHKLPRPVGLQASPERTDSSASADLTAIAVETIGVQATDEHVREEWTDQASRADNSGLSAMAPPPATPIDRVTPDQRVRTVGKSGGGRPTQDTISKRDEALRLFGFNLTDASGRTTCPFCGWGRASKEKKKIEVIVSNMIFVPSPMCKYLIGISFYHAHRDSHQIYNPCLHCPIPTRQEVTISMI